MATFELCVPGHAIGTFDSLVEAQSYREINYWWAKDNEMWIVEKGNSDSSPIAPLGDSDDWFGCNEDL